MEDKLKGRKMPAFTAGICEAVECTKQIRHSAMSRWQWEVWEFSGPRDLSSPHQTQVRVPAGVQDLSPTFRLNPGGTGTYACHALRVVWWRCSSLELRETHLEFVLSPSLTPFHPNVLFSCYPSSFFTLSLLHKQKAFLCLARGYNGKSMIYFRWSSMERKPLVRPYWRVCAASLHDVWDPESVCETTPLNAPLRLSSLPYGGRSRWVSDHCSLLLMFCLYGQDSESIVAEFQNFFKKDF